MPAAVLPVKPDYRVTDESQKWLLDRIRIIESLADQWPLEGMDIKHIQDNVDELVKHRDWIRERGQRSLRAAAQPSAPPQPTIVRAAAEATGGSDASFTVHLRGRVQRALAPGAAGGPTEDTPSEAPSITYGGPESPRGSSLPTAVAGRPLPGGTSR